jgi:hypothetical protein
MLPKDLGATSSSLLAGQAKIRRLPTEEQTELRCQSIRLIAIECEVEHRDRGAEVTFPQERAWS